MRAPHEALGERVAERAERTPVDETGLGGDRRLRRLPWRDRVAAVVQGWYPGQAGGTAIARVLFGDGDPSGRLPVSFPVREADLPTAGSTRRYAGTAAQHVHYEMGVLVGYCWFAARGIAPAYPFGHGVSHTSFGYSDLRAEASGVTFAVRNTGARRGAAAPHL